jgi:hypothetical protein
MRPKNHPAAWREENERGARDIGQVARLSRQRGLGISQPSMAAHPRTGHHPEYPLERICTHVYEPFQLQSARHAGQLLSGQDDVQSEPSHRGLIVRAETEPILSKAVEVLLDFYAPQIQVGPPTIRCHEEQRWRSPWMGIEMRCAPRFLESVKADLAMRRARVVSSELHSTGTVIQATAPLAHVIGLCAGARKADFGYCQRSHVVESLCSHRGSATSWRCGLRHEMGAEVADVSVWASRAEGDSLSKFTSKEHGRSRRIFRIVLITAARYNTR